MSLMGSRRYFRVQLSRKTYVFRATGAVSKNHQIKKEIHTTQSAKQYQDGKKNGRIDDDDDYELDLITLTRRKKQKKQQPKPVQNDEAKADEVSTTITGLGMQSPNIRADDYIFKKNKKRTPFLDSEDVRIDNDLISMTSKDLKKVKSREKYRLESPSQVSPLFDSTKSDEIASKFTDDDIHKFNEDIKDNLTRYLNEEYDKVVAKKSKIKPSDLHDIISTATAKVKDKRSSHQNADDELVDTANKDSKSDDGLIQSSFGSKQPIKDESNSKSDDDLIPKTSQSAGQKEELAGEDNKDANSAENVAESNTNLIDDDLIKTAAEIAKGEAPETITNTNDSGASLNKAEEVLEYLKHQPQLGLKEEKHKANDDVANISVPKADTKTTSEFKYNTKDPEIDELNRIINVSKPILPSKSQLKRVRKRNKQIMSELTNLTPNEKINKINDIMKILENEIPKLQRSFSDSELVDASDRIKGLRDNFEKVQKVEPHSFDNVDISLKDLEGFLEDAKKKQVSRDEEHFREERAYESSRIMNDENARTLDKKNFFTPVDESLTRNITSSLRFRPSATEVSPSDELFFPSLKPQNHLTHEYMVLTKSKKIVTEENPLGDDYHPQDLFTIFRNLGNPEKYLKQINKLEKNGGWKLIGSGGDTNKILIFERFVDKDQEKKDLRKQRFRRFAWSFTTVFVLLYGFGSYFEYEQKAQYRIDENGKLVKNPN